MKDNYTHICVVLDASGSMSSVEEATKKTMHDFIEDQKKATGDTTMSIYQFDDTSRKILDFQDMANLKQNPMNAYTTGGCTALYDTICDAIDQTGEKLSAMKEEERPSKVIIAILTDGFENASKRFQEQDVKSKIQHQTDVYKWTFMFLAANQDAVLTGSKIGVSRDACLHTFTDTFEDMRDNLEILSEACNYCRIPGKDLVLEELALDIREKSTNPRFRTQGKKKTSKKV